VANRAYLYSLSNRPADYQDRPETISGLAEWAYDVPFMFRLLMSGDPQLCASLITDELDADPPDQKTRLHAISSPFDAGFERVRRFVDIARLPGVGAAPRPAPAASVAAPAPTTFIGRLKRLFASTRGGVPTPPPVPVPAPAVAGTAHFLKALDETVAFLEAHRDTRLLLETIELDGMSEHEESGLRSCVEQEIARCREAGAAVDALPADPAAARRLLQKAITHRCAAPLDAFYGLHLDDDYDSTRSGATREPLGLEWSTVLYYSLWNRARFEASTE
jgi:hypothetical protein